MSHNLRAIYSIFLECWEQYSIVDGILYYYNRLSLYDDLIHPYVIRGVK